MANFHRRCSRNTMIALAGLILAAMAQRPLAAENEFPEKGKSIRIIVPFDAGGSTGAQARLIADFMTKDLGTKVEVATRPGTDSQTSLQQLASARPDGYTIGVTSNPASMGVYLSPGRKAKFNRASFAPIGQFVFDPQTIVVTAHGPYRAFNDLVAAAKSRPGTVRATTNGMLGDDHMAIALVQKATGIKFAIVHHESSADVVVGLLAGKSDAAFMGASATLPHVQSGAMRHIAVMDDAANPLLPGVPTLKSLGIDLVIGSSRGLSAPRGTPREIVAVLEASLARAVKNSGVVQKISGMSMPIRHLGGAAYGKLWADLEARIRPAVELMQEDQPADGKGAAKK